MYYNNVHGMHLQNHPYYQYSTDDLRDVQSTCRRLQDFYVIGQMADGTQMEGIIEDMDEQGVTMLVPETVEEDGMEDNRIFGVYGGGYGRRRFRRYRRRRFPYFQFVFPFFYPYPFFY